MWYSEKTHNLTHALYGSGRTPADTAGYSSTGAKYALGSLTNHCGAPSWMYATQDSGHLASKPRSWLQPAKSGLSSDRIFPRDSAQGRTGLSTELLLNTGGRRIGGRRRSSGFPTDGYWPRVASCACRPGSHLRVPAA